MTLSRRHAAELDDLLQALMCAIEIDDKQLSKTFVHKLADQIRVYTVDAVEDAICSNRTADRSFLGM